VAPGTIAPVESVTTPFSPPVTAVCANETGAKLRIINGKLHIATNIATVLILFFKHRRIKNLHKFNLGIITTIRLRIIIGARFSPCRSAAKEWRIEGIESDPACYVRLNLDSHNL
jgi:hypothetical protein